MNNQSDAESGAADLAHDLDSGSLVVCFAYNDAGAARNAKGLLDHLIERFGDIMNFCPRLWHFDLLAFPPTRELARIDAAESELLVVAYSAANSLAPTLTAWVEQWAECHRGTSAALVALPSGAALAELRSDRAETAVRGVDFLRETAEARGLTFLFCDCGGVDLPSRWVGDAADRSRNGPSRRRAARRRLPSSGPSQ